MTTTANNLKLAQRQDIHVLLDKYAKQSILGIKETYLKKLVSNYNTSPLRATGKFGNSLSYEITDNGMVIYTTVDYIDSMIDGDSPAKAKQVAFDTLYRSIIDWATAKPVKLKGISMTQFAYRATRAIQSHGTTIYQLYGKKGKETGLVSDTINEESINTLMNDLSLTIEEYLVKEFRAQTI